MPTSKGKLFELAESYKRCTAPARQQKAKEKKKRSRAASVIQCKHYDEGQSLSLSYRLDVYQEQSRPPHQYTHEEPSIQMNYWDDAHSEAFYVEPFEAEETQDVPFREVTDDEEAMLNRIVQPREDTASYHPSDASYQAAAMEDEAPYQDSEDMLDKIVNQSANTAPSQAERHNARPQTDTAEREERPSRASQPEAPAPVEIIETAPEAPNSPEAYEDDMTDEEFAADIGAILQGKKVFDPNQKKTVNKGDNSAPVPTKQSAPLLPAPSSAPADAATLDPGKNEHKIFEKIAQSMQYANSYDLGSIALDARFDKMEKEIERDEVKTVLNTPPSLEETIASEPSPEEPEYTQQDGEIPAEETATEINASKEKLSTHESPTHP